MSSRSSAASALLVGVTLVLALLPIGRALPTAAQGGPALARGWIAAPVAPTLDSQNVDMVGHIGGAAGVITLQGNYAYVGAGPRLAVLDVSKPDLPTMVGKTSPWRDLVQDVAVAGSYAFVAADEAGLRVVDISDPANPTEVGFYDGLDAIYDVVVAGSYAYVTGYMRYNAWLRVVDVSDPANPTEVGSLQGNSFLDVAVAGDYVYVAAEGYLLAVDVSDPTNPRRLWSGDISGKAERLVVAAGYAYVATTEIISGVGASGRTGLAVVDISTFPFHPVEVGFFETPYFAWGVDVAGSYAYVIGSGSSGYWLRVMDISDPFNPTEVGFLLGDSFRDVAVAGDYVYVAAEGYLLAVDVSAPTNPMELGFCDTGPAYSDANSVAVVGDYAYVTDGDAGLRIVDISDPANPTEVGFYDTAGSYWDVAVAEGYAYVTDGDAGLRMVDISDPANPTEVGFYDTAGSYRDVAVAEGYAYVADGDAGLRVVDVSDPVNPTEVGFFDTPGDARDLAVAEGYAYVAEDSRWDNDNWYSGGLRVIDVSDPTHTAELGFCEMPEDVRDLTAVGGYTYVIDRYTGLRIVDVSDPASPTEVGFYDTPGSAGNVSVAAGYAYVADGNAGLRIVDVSNPVNPVEVGFFDTVNARGVAVAEGYAYVATRPGGLFILHPVYYSTSGRVLDGSGTPSVGVTVSAGHGRSGVSDASGVYTIPDLVAGTYVLTPALAGYTFWPTTRTVTLPPDATRQDFVVLPGPVTVTLPLSGTASLPGRLSYTDTQGLPTTLCFPTGALTVTTTLVLTPTLAWGGAGYALAGHAFELGAYRDGHRLPGLSFHQPVTVTIHYSAEDVRVVTDESQLVLWWRSDDGWEEAIYSCEPPSIGQLDLVDRVLEVSICHASLYGLFGPTRSAALPIVLRDY